MSDTADAPPKVLVWDIWIRIFHWSFAALILASWLTHEFRGSARFWHDWLGYAAVGLVALRIIWGLVGSHYARFTQFVPGPKRLITYLGDTARGREARSLGHNPLGALMVLFLLALSIALAVTGYVLTNRGMSLFGLGHRDLEELHGLLGNLYLIAVPLHIVGVVWESIRHRENLVAAMITGKKRS